MAQTAVVYAADYYVNKCYTTADIILKALSFRNRNHCAPEHKHTDAVLPIVSRDVQLEL
jgi:hypothetical protein